MARTLTTPITRFEGGAITQIQVDLVGKFDESEPGDRNFNQREVKGLDADGRVLGRRMFGMTRAEYNTAQDGVTTIAEWQAAVEDAVATRWGLTYSD